MYTQDDLLPLSGLQHLLFCERQCALIHVEQVWAENRFTAEGRIMHERVHDPDRESRGSDAREGGTPTWLPFPVEYKRGRPKKEDWDRVQLCAQAMCLEEMLEVDIPQGAIFYGKTRRRQDVVFDAGLRRKTEDTARRFHELVESDHTPAPVYGKKCERCSMEHLCLPKAVDRARSIDTYLKDASRLR